MSFGALQANGVCYSPCLTPVVANRVSVIILKDTEAAFRASIIFCFNPASIFYSSM